MILECTQQSIFSRKYGHVSAIVGATHEIPCKILSVAMLTHVQKEQTGTNVGKTQKEYMGNQDPSYEVRLDEFGSSFLRKLKGERQYA